MVYVGVLAAVLVLAAFMLAVVRTHLRAVEEARQAYQQALKQLAESPTDSVRRAECREAGRYYYRFLHIGEHAMLQDFPVPYLDFPEAADSRIEADIEELVKSANHAA